MKIEMLSALKLDNRSVTDLDVLEIIVAKSLNFYSVEDLLTDDVKHFEHIANNLDLNLNEACRMITEEYFAPLPEITPSAIFRINDMATRNSAILKYLIERKVLRIEDCNDALMNTALGNCSPTSLDLIKYLLSVGFSLSDDVIQSHFLNQCSAYLLNSLDQFKPYDVLKENCIVVLLKMFGPNGRFDAEIVNMLMRKYSLVEGDARALLLHNNKRRRALLYNTRCFEQSNAVAAWSWVLNKYGGDHIFSEYCFDDLLLWMSDNFGNVRYQFYSTNYVAEVFQNFIRSSFDILKPRHWKFLIEMALASTWASLALEIIGELGRKFSRQTTSILDSDLSFLWLIEMKKSLKQLQTSIPTKSRDGSSIYNLRKSCIVTLKDTIRVMDIQPSSSRFRGLGLKKFLTYDGTAKVEERRSLDLSRSTTMEPTMLRKYSGIFAAKPDSKNVQSKRYSLSSGIEPQQYHTESRGKRLSQFFTAFKKGS